MSGLSRFSGRACSLLARRSDVGGRGGWSKRTDWSRPVIGSPSRAATQRNSPRRRYRAGLSSVSWCPAVTRRGMSSGLDPRSHGSSSSRTLSFPVHNRPVPAASLTHGTRCGSNLRGCARYIRGISARWPASIPPVRWLHGPGQRCEGRLHTDRVGDGYRRADTAALRAGRAMAHPCRGPGFRPSGWVKHRRVVAMFVPAAVAAASSAELARRCGLALAISRPALTGDYPGRSNLGRGGVVTIDEMRTDDVVSATLC